MSRRSFKTLHMIYVKGNFIHKWLHNDAKYYQLLLISPNYVSKILVADQSFNVLLFSK